jgi:hypothetical protein
MARFAVGSPPYYQLRQAVVLSLAGAVPLLALLLAARRVAGALAQPLSTSGLLGCGLLLAGWALVVRELLVDSRGPWPSGLRSAVGWMPTTIVLLAALALLPGASVAGAGLFVALLAVEEAASWLWIASGRRALSGWRGGARRTARSARVEPPVAKAFESPRLSMAELDEANSASTLDDDLTATLVRRREPDGREKLSGSIRAPFVAGQRTAPVHVPFCPPFCELPRCEAEPVDGPPASIRVAQVLPYGVRFDVKLEAPAPAATSVWIEFSVIERPKSEVGSRKSDR